MLHATGFFAPDPFVLLDRRGRREIVLSDLELDRGRREARVDRVTPESEIAQPLAARLGRTPRPPEVIAEFLRRRRVTSASVPSTFPLGLARALAGAGIRLEPVDGLFWPGRERKSPEELDHLARALRLAEAGVHRAWEILRSSRPRSRSDRTLVRGGAALTSEQVRGEIESAISRLGGSAQWTIVAGGVQACDPHEPGHGALHADELIILDVFPRDLATGYYGDITRTVVRGRATDAQRALWHAVLEAQRLALEQVRPGTRGAAIDRRVRRLFQERGYVTGEREGRRVGFFHGLGHGLGLELHEPPRFLHARFRPGQVLTVEPGLYYPEIGGVRHEDVIAVTAGGCRLLTGLDKPIEI